MPRPRAYLDIDIDGRRAAYARACAFVEATNTKYGFTSQSLSELGGSERARVLEYYSTDFTWAGPPIALDPAPHERIVLELFDDAAPNAVANFLSLCAGDKGLAKGSGRRLHYKGTPFHRIVKGFMAQAGDFVLGNGCGGESIWGGVFKDEKGALALKHDHRGVLSMCNTGKNSNGSQFFFTFGPARQLNGKHCVFGAVVEGWEVLDALEAAGSDPGVASQGDAPTVPVIIVDCGRL